MLILHLFNSRDFDHAVKEAQDFTNRTGVEAKIVTVVEFRDVVLADTYIEASEIDLTPVVMTRYNLPAMSSYGVKIPNYKTLNT